MKISIKDFLSLKNVEFEINKGLTVIAGQNGAGKTHLFLGIAHNDSGYLLPSYGYGNEYNGKIIDTIIVEPKPSLVLFRPAVRRLAEANKNMREAQQVPFNNIINASQSKQGYSYSDTVQSRYVQLYAILANIYIAGNILDAKPKEKKNWQTICESFNNVFDKELCGEYKSNGATVGIRLPDATISSMNTLSTGELEFISLLCDLIIENDDNDSETADLILIDELDAHFHPDLQLKVIKTIEHLCTQKFVLISTHSPGVMMSVSSDRLFYLNHYSKCKNEKNGGYDNQIESVSKKHNLYQKLFEMYNTLMNDLELVNFYAESSNNAILKFAEEGLSEDSTALPPNSVKDGDLQISSLKHIIANISNPEIIEVGCGVGRTLAMFKGFDKTHLSKISYTGFDIRPENVEHLTEYISSDEIKSLGLKTIQVATEIDEHTSGNLCIFANVIHEILPNSLAKVLNNYFHTLKPQSTCCILEVLELNVGEKAFVMQYPESIDILFSKMRENETLEFVTYTDITRNGIPLMFVNAKVKNPTSINISDTDVFESLKAIVSIESNILRDHYLTPSQKLNATSYSFHSHNLANALTFIDIINESSHAD